MSGPVTMLTGHGWLGGWAVLAAWASSAPFGPPALLLQHHAG